MASYKVDRGLLEARSTQEILRILKSKRDDYTPEAIAVFEEILRERGVAPSHSPSGSALTGGFSSDGSELLVQSPQDAVRVLNDVLGRVLSGTLDPSVGQAASNIVLSILKASEQEYMYEAEEGS